MIIISIESIVIAFHSQLNENSIKRHFLYSFLVCFAIFMVQNLPTPISKTEKNKEI
jgi:hypothetical protein